LQYDFTFTYMDPLTLLYVLKRDWKTHTALLKRPFFSYFFVLDRADKVIRFAV